MPSLLSLPTIRCVHMLIDKQAGRTLHLNLRRTAAFGDSVAIRLAHQCCATSRLTKGSDAWMRLNDIHSNMPFKLETLIVVDVLKHNTPEP